MAASALLLLGFATAASAQEAVRMSMASAQAAEARRRAATTLGHYSLELGPTAWNFGAGLGLDYNDNVNYTDSNPESDFIVRPQINTRMLWPISDRNSIDLSVGAGYLAYLQQPGLSRFFVTPDSELSFDLYAGDVWINLHDRISITENGYQDPTVVGSGDYSQLENTVGVSALWELNKAVLRWGYDHQNYSVLSGDPSRPDGQSEVFSASAGYAPKSGVLYGVELGGALINYTTTTTNTSYPDARQWSVGGFYETQVSEYIHFTGHAGYTVYTPDSSGTTVNGGDFTGMYAQLALTHRVNRYVDYSLTGGRSISFALFGGTVDMYSFNWQANWRVIRKTSLSTAFVYNHGSQGSSSGETFDQYGPQIRLGWRLSDKLSSSVGYQFYQRNSNESGRGYSVNVVSFDLKYTF
jgi:hypothetical protein